MRQYRLTVRNRLFFTRVAIKHKSLVRVVSLLVDSGSSYTIVSLATLISLGLDPASLLARKSVTTANGLVWMPMTNVEGLSVFGESISDVDVLAHTIPLGIEVSGILGMDLLRRLRIRLDFGLAVVEV
jgi:predicted aspartyl protease